MGFISDWMDPKIRKEKRIASLSKKLQQKFGQSEDRMSAANALRNIGGEDAIAGLLRRFSVTVDNKLHDGDEKNEISDTLADMGPEVVPVLKSYLKREIEITWAFRTLKRLVSESEYIAIVLEILGNHDSEDTDPEKICQILTVLHDQKDPRVAPAIARCLTDIDDTVRFAAIEALATINDDAAKTPLLQALTRPEEDSQRVIQRIIEVFKDNDWEVKGFRKTVEERLPEGFYLDRSGHIKQLLAGEVKAPDT